MKKIAKLLSIISIVLFVLCELLNFLFQGIVYNYFIYKATAISSENNYWEIGLKYKNFGVWFSEIGNILIWLVLVLIIVYLVTVIFEYIKTNVNRRRR